MKVAAVILAVLVGAGVIFAVIVWADDSIAPLFLNSRIERLGETGLPKIRVESGDTIYCRMKADDFRFPLPPGSRAVNPIVTGGFDTIDGTVEARFDETNRVTADQYRTFLIGKVQIGGQITAQETPEGLLIKFHYFGDR
jgi:hypothetical protein